MKLKELRAKPEGDLHKLLATSKAYKEFRELRYKSDDVYAMVKKLDKYSEIGELYGEELGQVIRYNKLTKYDLSNPR